MNTIEKLKKMTHLRDELEKITDELEVILYPIYAKWMEMKGKHAWNQCDLVEDTPITVDGENICFEFEVRSCGCCPAEFEYGYLPISAVEDWATAIKEYEEAIAERKRKEEEEKKKRAEVLARIKEQKRLAEIAKEKELLKDLAAKYPEIKLDR